VRQLQNVVEKCVVLSHHADQVPLTLVQRALSNQGGEMLPFDEARRQFERDYLTQLLKLTSGNVTQAAKLAQRNRTDFYALLGRHQIDPADVQGLKTCGIHGRGCRGTPTAQVP
jgi:two-component system response regulator GlrR